MLQFKEGNGWKCCYDPETGRLIHNGRHLFMSVDDRCGPPYTVILDSDYEKLCPWSTAVVSGRTWDDNFTDAVVEVLACEADNREQRREERKAREQKSEQEGNSKREKKQEK